MGDAAARHRVDKADGQPVDGTPPTACPQPLPTLRPQPAVNLPGSGRIFPTYHWAKSNQKKRPYLIWFVALLSGTAQRPYLIWVVALLSGFVRSATFPGKKKPRVTGITGACGFTLQGRDQH